MAKGKHSQYSQECKDPPTPAMFLWLVALTDDVWPQNKWVSRTHRRTFLCHVWWSRAAAPVFEISCGKKTDTDKNHKNPTPPRNCRRRGNKSFFNVNANVLKLEPLLLPLPLLESYCKGKEKEDNLYSAIYYACIVSKRTWITQFSANYTMPAFPS